MKSPVIKYVYMQNFMFAGISVIEILDTTQPEEEDEEEHGKTVKYHITPIFLIFSQYH